MISIAKPYIGDEEKKLVMEVLDSGMLAQGPKVAALEEAFAALCNVKHAIATTSGTTALHAALLAHDIGPGDGRWRWMIIDFDSAFIKYEKNMTEFISLERDYTLILNTLMKNPDYQIAFINKYADLLNTTFLPERVGSEIDQLVSPCRFLSDLGRIHCPWSRTGHNYSHHRA